MYPNASTAPNAFDWCEKPGSQWCSYCGDPDTGCLFQLNDDPNETNNLMESSPNDPAVKKKKQELLDRIIYHNKTVFSPCRGPGEMDKDTLNRACQAAHELYDGFFGAFLDVPGWTPKTPPTTPKQEL